MHYNIHLKYFLQIIANQPNRANRDSFVPRWSSVGLCRQRC